ncbi:hypothetical protein M440DRAFT_16414 [Trichoderma longibrachiatum ATCC 18648]|uniref:Uncharacterized protein n=1 Tax=Trichoderma longibrachiatum ATCC 18648 TaxID=983965 RepID=A0A2T4CEZ9_TRILO|nr:hypothetical protein M440DRAFT_16414 [Trichoderma longibrachiatum ATCC 18648]
MKSVTFALLAAAGVEQVAATLADLFAQYNLGNSWTNAKPFSCPSNTDNNHCTEQQHHGWDWSDVPTGPIGHYSGCNFKGWSCENDFGKRDSLLSARTFGSTGRSISGQCTHDKTTTPCIYAGDDKEHFSIDTFSVTTEFDARLEFHYDMPDGSTCKHSADCSSHGTTVKNNQCGGAKSVCVVYPDGNKPSSPSKPNKPSKPGKSTCGAKVHHIGWNCNNNSPPSGGQPGKPGNTRPPYTPPQTTQPGNSGICAGDAGSNPAIVTGAETITSIITVTSTPVVAPTDYTTVVVATSVTQPVVSEGTTVPGSSTVVWVSTAVTIPQVSITAAPAPPAPTGAAPTAPAEVPAPAPTVAVPPPAGPIGTATGTGVLPGSTGIPVIGAAGRVGAGMSLGLAIIGAVFAL